MAATLSGFVLLVLSLLASLPVLVDGQSTSGYYYGENNGTTYYYDYDDLYPDDSVFFYLIYLLFIYLLIFITLTNLLTESICGHRVLCFLNLPHLTS